jgi:hypothetical protein
LLDGLYVHLLHNRAMYAVEPSQRLRLAGQGRPVPCLKGDAMFQLVRALAAMDLAVRQVPVFAVSFLLASLFYRFGSFALETGAFLATWFVLDAAVEGAQLLWSRRPFPEQAP